MSFYDGVMELSGDLEWDELREQAAAIAAEADKSLPKHYEIGVYGRYFDRAGTCRAYTYDHQPDNVLASRIGSALIKAHSDPYGDSIDQGLSLLRRLQDAGIGIFEIPKD